MYMGDRHVIGIHIHKYSLSTKPIYMGDRHDVGDQRQLPNKDPRSYNEAQKAVLEAHFQAVETRISKETARKLARQIDCLERGRQVFFFVFFV